MSIDAGTAIVQPIKETSSAIKFPCADYQKGVLDFVQTNKPIIVKTLTSINRANVNKSCVRLLHQSSASLLLPTARKCHSMSDWSMAPKSGWGLGQESVQRSCTSRTPGLSERQGVSAKFTIWLIPRRGISWQQIDQFSNRPIKAFVVGRYPKADTPLATTAISIISNLCQLVSLLFIFFWGPESPVPTESSWAILKLTKSTNQAITHSYSKLWNAGIRAWPAVRNLWNPTGNEYFTERLHRTQNSSQNPVLSSLLLAVFRNYQK